RLDHFERDRAKREELPTIEPIWADLKLLISGADATTGPLGQHCSAFGMIKMPVRQHNRDQPWLGGCEDRLQMGFNGGPGIDDERTLRGVGDHPRVRTIEGHCAWVGGPYELDIRRIRTDDGCHRSVSREPASG